MLTEQESHDMHFMVREFEEANSAIAWFKLRRLAETTGDDWYKLVRQYLAERYAERR